MKRCYITCSIDNKGAAPPIVKNKPQFMVVSFRVREEEAQKVFVDMIVDLKLNQAPFVLLSHHRSWRWYCRRSWEQALWMELLTCKRKNEEPPTSAEVCISQ
jgi:hypothetical protein